MQLRQYIVVELQTHMLTTDRDHTILHLGSVCDLHLTKSKP